jgi:hypothetical protein
VATQYSSFDAGRGCPFQCSFCTIINVQGRKSRYRSAHDVEDIGILSHSMKSEDLPFSDVGTGVVPIAMLSRERGFAS